MTKGSKNAMSSLPVLVPQYNITVITAISTITGLLHLHCKKRLTISPSPAGMSLTNLFLAGNNLILCVWLVTSWLVKGKSLTFFYSVVSKLYPGKHVEFYMSSISPRPCYFQFFFFVSLRWLVVSTCG
jgi:uncharacterized membrane protein